MQWRWFPGFMIPVLLSQSSPGAPANLKTVVKPSRSRVESQVLENIMKTGNAQELRGVEIYNRESSGRMTTWGTYDRPSKGRVTVQRDDGVFFHGILNKPKDKSKEGVVELDLIPEGIHISIPVSAIKRIGAVPL